MNISYPGKTGRRRIAGFDEVALLRKGIANNNKSTVRALGYHIAGHELHHTNIIREKYLNK